MVSNTEGSSSFFTHGSGGGGLISPSSNAGQNADRSSRGGDSNESSPHGVNSGSNSPHLRLVFGHISIQQKSNSNFSLTKTDCDIYFVSVTGCLVMGLTKIMGPEGVEPTSE